MANDPRVRNGYRRRNLRTRILREETHCGICGDEVDKTLATPHPMSAEVDEIVPISLGGNPLDRHNTQLTHRVCNSCKSAGQHRGFCPLCLTKRAAAATPYVTPRIW